MNRELKPNEPGEPLNSNEREGEVDRPWFFRIIFQLDDPRTMFLRLYGLVARSGQMDGDVRFILRKRTAHPAKSPCRGLFS